ncbi:MAG: tyrosine-type recombinase/integrase [Limisphaerales bacterium]
MKQRFILYRRGEIYYCEDTVTRKQESLRTKDEAEALALLHAKNEAFRQPILNLRIARTYLSATDDEAAKRTWQIPVTEIAVTKKWKTRERYERATQDKAFDIIRNLPILETQAEHFLRVLKSGKVSTNNYLRRFHNFALDMNWLPQPVLPKKQWPKIKYKEKRAVTPEDHELILVREKNLEMNAFLRCCWEIGGSQSDVAHLKAENIDWNDRVVSFFRAKTGTVQTIHFGESLAEVLHSLPKSDFLFPRLAAMDEKHRASLFQRACRRVNVRGISLHSYRYSWAERAKTAGYPERFAMENLGHNSKAIHRSYARKAKVLLPSLEEYERKIIQLHSHNAERNGVQKIGFGV